MKETPVKTRIKTAGLMIGRYFDETPRLEFSTELPPSVNHSHQNVTRRTKKGKTYTAKSPTPATRRWRTQAHVDAVNAKAAAKWRTPEEGAKVVVEITYFWPDESRDRDTHNRIKELMDALQRPHVFTNDCCALARELDYQTDPERPRIELCIWEKTG